MGGGDRNPVLVDVEWALRGKTPNDRGYRMLSWSTGTISASNFEDILERFSPGTLDMLPQVVVSFVLAGNGSRYLGMAIYEPQAGGVDRDGRGVAFTRYFCVPYEEVASGAVSYLAMYRALVDIRLPESNGSPFPVEFARGDLGVPEDAARALQVAELLLTGNPVCVIDAGGTGVADRLAFIDAVMLLLPYGMRAEMAAATWTSSVYRSHKFRLFFSEAPRRPPDSGPEDHLVAWRPDELQVKTALTPRFNPEWGEEYRDWLKPLLEKSVTVKLAGLTEPIPFKPGEILKTVEMTSQSQARWWKKRGTAPNPEIGGRPAADDQQAKRQEPKHAKVNAPPGDPVELMLSRFDSDMRAGNTAFVESSMDQIPARLATSPPTEAQRERYRAIIKDRRLLRDELPLKKKGAFYKVLLRAAFGPDVDYRDFLRILNMLGDGTAQKTLLEVIDEASTDSRVKFIVQYQLDDSRYPRFGIDWLIGTAEDPELRDDHVGLIRIAMIAALRNARSAERENARKALRERGFLATRLRARAPNDLKFQVYSLATLLRALYGDRLDEYACEEIFTGYRNAPTEALLTAAYMLVVPEAEQYLRSYFIEGIAGSSEVDQGIRAGFARFGYGPDTSAAPGAPLALGAAGAVPGTALDIPVSKDEAFDYLKSLAPADPPTPKRGPLKRLLNPGGGIDKKPPENR